MILSKKKSILNENSSGQAEDSNINISIIKSWAFIQYDL